MTYGELIALSFPGFVAFAVGALPAGWLGDRWNRIHLMALFFLGIGGASILTGLAQTPWQIAGGTHANRSVRFHLSPGGDRHGRRRPREGRQGPGDQRRVRQPGRRRGGGRGGAAHPVYQLAGRLRDTWSRCRRHRNCLRGPRPGRAGEFDPRGVRWSTRGSPARLFS